MTMQDDQQMIKAIADGGPFDPVQAIRALARSAAANTPAKQAPAAVMDAGPSASSGTGSGTGPAAPSTGSGAGLPITPVPELAEGPPAKKRPAKENTAE